jgi:hypothetical protein
MIDLEIVINYLFNKHYDELLSFWKEKICIYSKDKYNNFNKNQVIYK